MQRITLEMEKTSACDLLGAPGDKIALSQDFIQPDVTPTVEFTPQMQDCNCQPHFPGLAGDRHSMYRQLQRVWTRTEVWSFP